MLQLVWDKTHPMAVLRERGYGRGWSRVVASISVSKAVNTSPAGVDWYEFLRG